MIVSDRPSTQENRFPQQFLKEMSEWKGTNSKNSKITRVKNNSSDELKKQDTEYMGVPETARLPIYPNSRPSCSPFQDHVLSERLI